MEIKNNKVYVIFDFLNPKDSFLIRVIHTGNNKEMLQISGSIIGEKRAFSESGINKTLESGLYVFIGKFMRLAISPKLKWARVTIDYVVGILFLSYVFLANPSNFIMIMCLFFGILSLVAGTKRIFRKSNSYKLDRFEHQFNSQMQEALNKLKSSMK